LIFKALGRRAPSNGLANGVLAKAERAC